MNISDAKTSILLREGDGRDFTIRAVVFVHEFIALTILE